MSEIGFLHSTILIQRHIPNLGNTDGAAVEAIVSFNPALVEYERDAYHVNVSDSMIHYDFLGAFGFLSDTSAFNGEVITVTQEPILGAVLWSTSGQIAYGFADPIRVSSDADHVYINYSEYNS